MRKFIGLPVRVVLAGCTERMAVGPEGDEAERLAAKDGKGKGGGGGGGGGGGDEPLPTDPAAIVFVRYGNPYQLVVMDADGSNQTVVHEASYLANPSWSPDGRIVFRQEDALRQLDKFTGELVADWQVACTPAFGPRRVNCQPAWSPADSEIAIADGFATDPNWPSLWVISATGGEPTLLYTYDGMAVRWPTWDPSGERSAFVQDEGPTVKVVNRTTHYVEASCTLSQFPYAESLEWGRTKDLIVFSSLVAGERKGGVYTLDINHNCEVSGPIVSGGNNPVWSPDDQWIAWVKTRGDKLMLSDATGNSYSVASRARDPDWLRINRTN